MAPGGSAADLAAEDDTAADPFLTSLPTDGAPDTAFPSAAPAASSRAHIAGEASEAARKVLESANNLTRSPLPLQLSNLPISPAWSRHHLLAPSLTISHHLPPSLTFSHNLPQSPRPERDFLVAELLDRLPVDAKVESVGTVLERLPSWKRAAFYSGRLEEVLAHSRAADVRRAMLGGFETMLSEEQEYARYLT